MEWARAIEGIGKCQFAGCVGTASPDLDEERVRLLDPGNDSSGHDLHPTFRDELSDRRGDFGCDPVPVDVPPRPRMPKEAPLLLAAEALPQSVAMRPEAVDRGLPAHLGASLPQPAPDFAQIVLGELVVFDGRRLEVRMGPR